MRIRVLLADHQAIVRAGLRSILQGWPEVEVVGEAEDGEQTVRLARELQPDVVMIDMALPGSGAETARRLLAGDEEIRVLALSGDSDRASAIELLRAGTRGYVLKSCVVEELRVAVQAIMNKWVYISPRIADVLVQHCLRDGDPGAQRPGRRALTAREREVLQLIAEGKTSREAATQLSVAAKTIETHRQQIMDKLNIRSVAELTKYAVRHGLTSLEA